MKTRPNICGYIHALIIDSMPTHRAKSTLWYFVCATFRAAQETCRGLNVDVHLSVQLVSVSVRSPGAHAVCFSLLIPQAVRCMSHLCMCPRSARRALLPNYWDENATPENNNKKKDSCWATYHPQGAKCIASSLHCAIDWCSPTVSLNISSGFILHSFHLLVWWRGLSVFGKEQNGPTHPHPSLLFSAFLENCLWLSQISQEQRVWLEVATDPAHHTTTDPVALPWLC